MERKKIVDTTRFPVRLRSAVVLHVPALLALAGLDVAFAQDELAWRSGWASH